MEGDGAEAQRHVGASAAPDANQGANAARSEPTGEKRKRHIHDDNERWQRRDKAYPDKKGGKNNRSKAKSRKEYNAGTDGKRARIDASRMRSSQRSDRSVAIHATQFSKEEIEAEERRPKRKVAVMIGYAGTGYHGMQMSHKLRTIEGDLFQAFVKAGAVSKANADDPKKLSFVRCARTDKGVHAAGNIISLKLVIEDPDIVAKINEHLVPQIRVWGIERTLNGFSAHTNVDSRVYEYLIPTHCFLPPHPKSFLASWLAGHAEETGDREAWLARQKDVANFWDRAHEEYVEPALEQLDPELRDSAWEKIFEQDENEVEPEFDEATEGKAVDADDADDAEADGVGERGAESKEQVEDTAKPKKQPHEMTPIEEAQKKLKIAMMAAKKAWRIGPERLARLKQVLSRFEGVKNFHNYTVRVSPTDPSTTRIIKSFIVSGEPFVINDTEWISMKVHGQSFMMHQIRKMVGMAANVVRCGTHEGRFQDSWELNRLSIPRAPGLGLLLERPIFDNYNKKIQTQQGGAERNDVTFVPYEKEIQEFKQREIYDRIHREEARGNHFHQLFWSIDNLPRSQFLYLSSKGMAALQGEWRGKRMTKYKSEAT